MKNVVNDPQKVTRILATATTAFGQQGFAKTKTDDIAATAGVSKGLIFHYFGNKQDLYLDTFKTAYHRIYDHMNPHKWQDAPGLAAMMTQAVNADATAAEISGRVSPYDAGLCRLIAFS